MAKTVSPGSERAVVCLSKPCFEVLLPAIKRQAAYAFRYRSEHQRTELIADVIARAFAMYCRLVDRGLAALAYSSALARLAIRQVTNGRRLGGRQNVRDVLSEAAQRKQRFQVKTDSTLGPGAWEAAITDRRASPAELAVLRVDFAAWLQRLGKMKRLVAERLIAGDTTSEAAQFFRVSASRISQLRRELRQDWATFQGDVVAI